MTAAQGSWVGSPLRVRLPASVPFCRAGTNYEMEANVSASAALRSILPPGWKMECYKRSKTGQAYCAIYPIDQPDERIQRTGRNKTEAIRAVLVVFANDPRRKEWHP